MTASSDFGWPAASSLIEIGADRRLHGVDEVAQDAVLVEAFDLLQRGFDRLHEPRLARLALVGRGEPRVEARVEQGHHVGGDGGVLDERRPHVVLGIGHADLPQEARDGADERDVAPHQAGGEHERVVAVALGAAGHDGQETRLQPLLERLDVDMAAVGALQHHVVEPDTGLGSPWRLIS